MKRILPVAIFIAIVVMLSHLARPSAPYHTAAAEAGQTNQFQLKKSFALGGQDHNLIATVYSCGTGVNAKEVISIWSREDDAYELQYIRTAAAGQSFLQPELFSIAQMRFVKISTQDGNSGRALMDTMLSVTPELTLHEIPSKQAKELIKIKNKA